MNRDAFHNQWVAMERYRLDVVRQWPPSARRDATLAAIYSTLASLAPEEPAGPSTAKIHLLPTAPAKPYPVKVAA